MAITRPLGLALLWTLLACASVHGQNSQAAPPDLTRFNTEIVVTPERGETPRALVPAASVVLDETSLIALPATHPSEILRFLPGFNVARPDFYAGRPVVSSRGFFGGGEAEYIRLLVDGVPVADVESGLIDWAIVPTSAIRRVEAVRGPGASLYGDSAIGGVIQILTDRTTRGGQATATGGSFNTVLVDGSYSARSGGIGFSISGAARRTDGGFEHSGGRELVGGGSAEGGLKGFSWRWSASGVGRKRDDPGALSQDVLASDPYSSDPLYRFDNVDRRGYSTAFTLRHGTPTWKPQIRFYATTRDEELIRSILLVPPNLGDRRFRSLSSAAIGGSAEGEHAFAGSHPVVLRFGMDLARQHLDTTYRSVSPTGDVGDLNSEASGYRVRAGAFASTSWDLSTRLRVSGTVRWDEVNDNEFAPSSTVSPQQRAWSPRIGAVARLTDTGSVLLFAQLSRAFKVPTLDQLFDPRPYPDFRGGSFSISNPDLVPQRATNVEVGVSGGGQVRLSALAYRMNVEDEIDFDVNTFSYANIGRSRHVGFELEGEGRRWKRVRPSLSYALSRVVELPGDLQLKNVPRHMVTAATDIDFPWSIGVFARYHHTWGAFLDAENVYPVDGPSTLDVRVRRPFKRHTFFVDALNVTGNVYEEYGFTLADFSGRPTPYAYPGAPRALRAGLTIVF
jgi:iron complex outermembrane receptor protein